MANKHGIVGGDTDLTEQGKQQVLETKDVLSGIRFDEVYSSDLKRAVQTAEILYGMPVEDTKRMHVLRERDFGAFEGQPEHVYQQASAQRKTMTHEQGWVHKHAPDYESDHELSSRFLPTLEKIAKHNPGKTVLIAGHGSAIRVVIMTITGYTYKELPSGSFVNAGYTELRYDPAKGFSVIQISGVKL
jgi:broad specificity phosphatase PhoE